MRGKLKRGTNKISDTMNTTPKKRGGPQPGSGAPKKPPGEKVVKCRISMTPAQHAATEGDRSGTIRRALDLYFVSNKSLPPKTEQKRNFDDDFEIYLLTFGCNECGNEDKDSFTYQRTVANGEVWICSCKAEIITNHKPNEDNY